MWLHCKWRRPSPPAAEPKILPAALVAPLPVGCYVPNRAQLYSTQRITQKMTSGKGANQFYKERNLANTCAYIYIYRYTCLRNAWTRQYMYVYVCIYIYYYSNFIIYIICNTYVYIYILLYNYVYYI